MAATTNDETSSLTGIPSDRIVSTTIQKGFFERAPIYIGTGLAAGALASIVLAPGGRGTATRKVITCFGAGTGLGSAWTKTSIELEKILK